LRELVAELNARSIKASYGSVWRLLDDEGISFKKKKYGPPRLQGVFAGCTDQSAST
jgi:transposase